MSKCLYCYKELGPGEVDFHKGCCRKFFGTASAPSLDYTRAQMDELAAQVIQSQTTLTGVQPKLSLNLDKHKDSQKLTIVGLWGDYIFKPQTERFAMLPENEDLTKNSSHGEALLPLGARRLLRYCDTLQLGQLRSFLPLPEYPECYPPYLPLTLLHQ